MKKSITSMKNEIITSLLDFVISLHPYLYTPLFNYKINYLITGITGKLVSAFMLEYLPNLGWFILTAGISRINAGINLSNFGNQFRIFSQIRQWFHLALQRNRCPKEDNVWKNSIKTKKCFVKWILFWYKQFKFIFELNFK